MIRFLSRNIGNDSISDTFTEGFVEGKLGTLITLTKENVISLFEASERAGMPLEDFMKLIS